MNDDIESSLSPAQDSGAKEVMTDIEKQRKEARSK